MAKPTSSGIARYVRRRSIVFALIVGVFVVGGIMGFTAVDNIDANQRRDLAAYLEQLTSSAAGGGNAATLARAASVEQLVGTVGLMWILGLSLIGAPLILAIIFMRAFALGFTVGFLWMERGFEGIALALAAVVPHQMFIVPGTLLAGAATLSFSAVAAAIIAGRRELSAFRHFAATTALCGVGAAVIIVGVFVEAYITPVLLQAAGGYLGLW